MTRYLKERCTGPAAVLGHSFGARIAIRIAAATPGLVSHLTLMGAAGIPRARGLKGRVRIAAIRMLGRTIRGLSPVVGAGPREWFAERFGSRDYKAAGDLRPVFVNVINENLTLQCAQIQAPTLLLWGEDDTETPIEMGRRFARLIPTARLVTLPHKDHFPHHGLGSHLCALYILRQLGAKPG